MVVTSRPFSPWESRSVTSGDTISLWNTSASRKRSDTAQRICNSIECTDVSRASLRETSTVAPGSAIQGRSIRVLSCDYRGSDATIHERWIGNVITMDSQSRDGTKTMLSTLKLVVDIVYVCLLSQTLEIIHEIA
ncbi:BgTH12-02076 [Blumeria graminis f. sp. triticale]|uniref:BgTH12-02076 n=1 Tax=Blumeria graminis f. sp. triticale TaxID=1689686 RepID=A0A9W4GFG6_BLUGR|nr:BgTH12-02076 [Blumeria graminis f. sp. triticale]